MHGCSKDRIIKTEINWFLLHEYKERTSSISVSFNNSANTKKSPLNLFNGLFGCNGFI